MLERQGARIAVRHRANAGTTVLLGAAVRHVKDRCVAVRAEPTGHQIEVLTWVPRSILWHASESSLT